MPDDKSELPIKAEVSAKLEVKTEIPPDASGRAVHELLNAISPFTEGMGIVGAHLRVHREKVLIKIAKIVRERLAIEGKVAIPVPPKFMVPFLEKASCEDIESELVDRWASLLEEAATDYSDGLLIFARILGELGAEEVRVLDKLTTPFHADLNLGRFKTGAYIRHENWQRINRLLPSTPGGSEESEEALEALFSATLMGPFHLLYGEVAEDVFAQERVTEQDPKKKYATRGARGRYANTYSDGPAIFEKLGCHDLIRLHQEEFHTLTADGGRRYRGAIELVEITPLGFEFVRCCRGGV